MLKKIFNIVIISLTALWVIGFIAYFIYLYNTYTLNPTDLVKEIAPLPAEAISILDNGYLEGKENCETTLREISNITGRKVEDPIDFIQTMTFMSVSDKAEQQFEQVRQLAEEAYFAFSFAELNSCDEQAFIKLDVPQLRQYLVELEESLIILNEMCHQEC
jgi:hypothetical protein